MRLHIPLKSQFMYKRLKKVRTKAKAVGLFYLFGIILLAVLALLPMLKIPYLSILPIFGDMKTVWDKIDFDLDLSWNRSTLNVLFYMVITITVSIVIPVIAFKSLGWLFSKTPVRKKGNATATTPYDLEADQRSYHGFNRNVYAMKELATLFSWSFALLIAGNTLLCLLNGSYVGTALFDFSIILDEAVITITDLGFGIPLDIPVIAIVLVVGFLFTWIGRLSARKIRQFTPSEGEGKDEKLAREGFFPLTVRTLLQFVAIIVVPMFLVQVNKIDLFVTGLLTGKFQFDLVAVVQLGVFVAWLALSYCPILYCHRCIVTEYNLPEQNIDHFFMLGITIFALLTSVALFIVTDMFKFDLTKVESLQIFMVVIVLGVVAFITAILTRASIRFAEYDSVIAMVTGNEEFEEINWKYAYSDNYMGGEEYVNGEETGSIIE